MTDDIINIVVQEVPEIVNITVIEGAYYAGDGSGMPGKDGKDGLSAYQIWLNAGNTGTEADFLNSLKGEKGDPGPMGPAGDGSGGSSIPTVATLSDTILTLDVSVDDYYFNGSDAATWTLPDVSTNTGKRFTISNIGSTILTLSGSLFTNTATSTINLLTGDSYELQSNGTIWKIK